MVDVRRPPFRCHSIEQVQAIAFLKQLDDPYRVLDELHRVITPPAKVRFDVPALGAHLDHKFLADLRLWTDILGGYYRSVRVPPLGVKYP